MRTASLLCIVLVLACAGPKTARMGPVKKFDKQGHRGCRGLMPENTIPAMLHAIDLGVTTLETDAVITRDNEVILSHEPFFNHEISTKPDGSAVTVAEEKKLNIYEMTYAEVARFDVGIHPHPRFPRQEKIRVHKPRLADMIDSVEQYCTTKRKPLPYYNIETKSEATTDKVYHPGPAEFVDLLMQVILSKKIEKRVIIQSFDPRTLQYLHEKYPAIQTAFLVEADAGGKKPFALQLKELGFIPSVYSPDHSLVTPLLIKQCHDTGIRIIPWTVNDRARIAELKQMGVDGIISDFPDLFKGM